MRMTREHTQGIISNVMSRIATPDYQSQIQKLVDDEAADTLDTGMKDAITKNPKLANMLAEKYLEAPFKCNVRNTAYEPSDKVREQVSKLRAQEAQFNSDNSELYTALLTVLSEVQDTRDVALVLPELAVLLPPEPVVDAAKEDLDAIRRLMVKLGVSKATGGLK